MYYKIENKESKVYKELYEMRSIELNTEASNKKALDERIGLKWESFLGYKGQQSYIRVTEYIGFEFLEPERVDLKIWKKHDKNDGIYIPNSRTKQGKEMSKVLLGGLRKHCYLTVFDILDIEYPEGRFTFPYVDITKNDLIILYLDNKHIPNNNDIIEITSKEFETLRKL